MDDPPLPRTSSLKWIVPVGLLVAVAAAGITWNLVNQPGPIPKDGPGNGGNLQNAGERLSRDEARELLLLRDRALGHLENGNFEPADEMLQQIIRLLPDDPFGHRNLAVCRDLAIETLSNAVDVDKSTAETRRRQAMDQARQAVEKLVLMLPKSYVSHVLAARLAQKQEDPTRAAQSLRQALQLSPRSAPVWYDLFLLDPIAPGEPPPPESVDALRHVHELAPENLFVLKDWLLLQAQLKEPEMLQTVGQARQTLEPFASVIKTNLRQDISDLLDKLAKAVEAQDWTMAQRMAMLTRNVILPEASRDQRYVQWNSMEYLLLDFEPGFYDRVDNLDSAVPPIPVTFAASQALALPTRSQYLEAVDFDFDGQLDVAALSGDRLAVRFSVATVAAATELTELKIGDGYSSLVAVDVDDDVDTTLKTDLKKERLADVDLIALGAAGVKFFENLSRQGAGRAFVEKPVGDEIAALRDVWSVVPADLDLDGDVDFATISQSGIQMWSNRGNWSFENITSRTKGPPDGLPVTAAIAVDWDRDTDLDILLATQDGLGILENLHHGIFRWKQFEGEFAGIKSATSLLVEQLGTAPSWSVIAAGPQGVHAVVTQTSAAGAVTATKVIAITDRPARSVVSLDFDNDGVRDLLIGRIPGVELWRGKSGGEFAPVAIESFRDGAAAVIDAIGAAIGDIDGDGDQDLLLSSERASNWLANEGGNANGWLDVTLIAQHLKPGEQNYTKRVNKLGYGSLIEVRAGERYQAQVAHQPQAHFGLGPGKNAEVLRIVWTNGLPQNVIAPKPNQLIYEEQILLGSCPYLYTWDGEKFAFFTDLLWNAPLGLKFAEDVIAPWREWEFLKIDGDRLRPRDGHYPLRVTAELWEIEYFDQIKLFAVDHPAGTQIFTNEKVGPASLATHRIHTVSRPRSPVGARDQRGRDVLPDVIARDEVYTRGFDQKLAQGLTTDHFLELDLGPWPRRDAGRELSVKPQLTLFLTGWMYPGSTSLRVQHSQNPGLKSPQPPALHAVDSQGNWREVRPFMGFPGGKTKTIAIDLSDVFDPGSDDHRLRIVTNMEFYWDHAFFTIDDAPVEFQQQELRLATARLIDRGGVSRHSWPATGNGPDRFDYNDLVPGDAWPPVQGAFTRFGDILPLLNARDDKLVVLHPGDEMQLEFAAPTRQLPEGWVRDFVIYNVGWDKDCDQNTVYGESTEPLPFEGMTIYPHREGEGRMVDDDYLDYLRTYQTRRRSRGPFWNRLVRDGLNRQPTGQNRTER